MSGLYHWVGTRFLSDLYDGDREYSSESEIRQICQAVCRNGILILLVLKPLTSGLRLEDQIAYAFEKNTFRSESQNLEDQILGIESAGFEEMIANYEKAVEKDVAVMALDLGFFCTEVHVTIEADQESSDYGQVKTIEMTVSKEQKTGGSERMTGASKGREDSIQVDPVDPVQIGERRETKEAGTIPVADDTLNRLRRKVEQYYELETVDVQIQLEE